MSAAGNLWHGTLPRMAVYPISPRKDWVRIFASASSAPSANSPNGNGTNVFGDTTQRTVNGFADDRADASGLYRLRNPLGTWSHGRCGRSGRKKNHLNPDRRKMRAKARGQRYDGNGSPACGARRSNQ